MVFSIRGGEQRGKSSTAAGVLSLVSWCPPTADAEVSSKLYWLVAD